MRVNERVSAQVRGLLDGWTVEVDSPAKSLAERINCGECGCFAEALVDRLVEEDGLNAFTLATDDLMVDRCKGRRGGHDTEGVHVWTYVPETGLHYDSEAPQGVADWMLLPFFPRWAKRHKIERASTPEREADTLRVTAAAWAHCRAEITKRLAARRA